MSVTIDPITVSTARLKMQFKNPDDQNMPITNLGIGTGFFWKHNNQTYLITNKHNVTGRHFETNNCLSETGGVPNIVEANFYVKGYKPATITWSLYYEKNDPNSRRSLWIENEGLDIAALKVNMNDQNVDCIYAADFDMDAIINIAQEVFVIGYPKGIHLQNLPIWKRATIASEIDIPAYKDQPTFLVDTATRQGMSGSPVFALVKPPYFTSPGNQVLAGGSGKKFLGIYSGRLGENEFEAQLGIIWKKEAIESIFNNKVKTS